VEYIVYKTTNLINGKIYIGKDCKNNPEYLGSGIILNKAIEKYGKNNFKKETIYSCKTKTELNDMEIQMIKKYNSFFNHSGYNIASGGIGGDTFTNNPNKEEIRKKISESGKGRIVSEETRNKIRIKQIGVPRPQTTGDLSPTKRPEVREKMSMANKGKNNPMFGHIYTQEERKKLSISHLGHKTTQETKDKISKALTGKTISEETRAKISKTLTGKKQSDYTKKKRLETRNKSKILRGKW